MSRTTPTVCTITPSAPPPIPPRREWPDLKPCARPSGQSPWRTVLVIGKEGDKLAVRVIIEGRDQAGVDRVAAEITSGA